MCIIVDANASHKMNGDHPDGSLVLKWLLHGKGKLVVSNELLSELTLTRFRDTIIVLDQAGRVCRVDEHRCSEYKDIVTSSGLMVSDDPHVLAIILSSDCDLIFTNDQPLHRDLKNRELVRPVSIYQTARHRALLGECRC
jgi:rRNA-processing protein FCF1